MAEQDAAMAALNAAQGNFDKTASLNAANWVQPWSQELVKFLSLSVLGFTCVALMLSAILLWRHGAPPSQILKTFGILVIIGVSTLLLVAGYSNEQLTPIVGLFGAIAGYLLGKDSNLDKS